MMEEEGETIDVPLQCPSGSKFWGREVPLFWGGKGGGAAACASSTPPFTLFARFARFPAPHRARSILRLPPALSSRKDTHAAATPTSEGGMVQYAFRVALAGATFAALQLWNFSRAQRGMDKYQEEKENGRRTLALPEVRAATAGGLSVDLY